MVTKRQKEEIDEIMENFNFNKIFKVMVILDWTWYPKMTVPTVDEIKDEVRKNLEHLCDCYNDNGTDYITTGGFEYGISRFEDEDLYVKFVAEEWVFYKE